MADPKNNKDIKDFETEDTGDTAGSTGSISVPDANQSSKAGSTAQPTSTAQPIASQATSAPQPTINRYTSDIKAVTPQTPKVDPTASAAQPAAQSTQPTAVAQPATAKPSTTSSPTTATAATLQTPSAKPDTAPSTPQTQAAKPITTPTTTPTQPTTKPATASTTPSTTTAKPAATSITTVAKPSTPPGTKPPTTTVNPANKKKVILGCLGAFASIMLILLILSFVFLAQSGEGQSPIAKLLGINQTVFVNGLITFVHIIFITISLVTFIFTMVGLFRASMAKKDDKETRKSGLKTALIAGITLFFILVIWGFTYIYLDSKRIPLEEEILDSIITDPEDTLGQSAPLTITFKAQNAAQTINKNKYEIISHDWDFGDGTTGTNQIVEHTFTKKGTYNVKLKITVKNKDTGEIGVGGEFVKTISIENELLAAVLKADPQSGEVPLEVSFDAGESSDPDGTIKSYEWDFDGNLDYADATGEKVKYTFDKIGKYEVSLRVTSTLGESDTEEMQIVVLEESNPEAVITIADDPKTFTTGLNYIFQADNSTSPNGKITKYEWTFSDSTKVETTKTISHTFKQAGKYEINLKVTDEKGEEGKSKKIIDVGSPKGSPKAKINTDPALPEDATSLNGKVPFTVVFDAKGSTDSDDNVVDYKWDFENDGQFDSFGNVVSHTYTEEGTYTVNLSVEDNDKNIGIASMVVKVESAGVIAALTADKVEGNVPLTINFDASGSSYSKGKITSYKWDFGDGTPVKIGAATISHKYTAIGDYAASVTVTTADGNNAVKTLAITVREIPLTACFVSVFEKGPAPLETSFDPGCSTGAISGYFWNFGDGSTSTSVKPTHVFEKPGEYKVNLEISDAENTIDLAEVIVTVTEK